MHFILFYDYVEDIVEQRAPFRAGHLGLAEEYVARGELILAGAYSDPTDGAALIFRVADEDAVRAFVERDPYVQNGLVTSWRIRVWNVVLGAGV